MIDPRWTDSSDTPHHITLCTYTLHTIITINYGSLSLLQRYFIGPFLLGYEPKLLTKTPVIKSLSWNHPSDKQVSLRVLVTQDSLPVTKVNPTNYQVAVRIIVSYSTAIALPCLFRQQELSIQCVCRTVSQAQAPILHRVLQPSCRSLRMLSLDPSASLPRACALPARTSP